MTSHYAAQPKCGGCIHKWGRIHNRMNSILKCWNHAPYLFHSRHRKIHINLCYCLLTIEVTYQGSWQPKWVHSGPYQSCCMLDWHDLVCTRTHGTEVLSWYLISTMYVVQYKPVCYSTSIHGYSYIHYPYPNPQSPAPNRQAKQKLSEIKWSYNYGHGITSLATLNMLCLTHQSSNPF